MLMISGRIGPKSESASPSKKESMLSPENRSHFSASCSAHCDFLPVSYGYQLLKIIALIPAS